MRVLLDECLPRRLKNEIPGHEVFTAREVGLAGKKNGELLVLAAAGFEVFVTVDQNLPAQNHLASLDLAVIVLRAKSSSIESLRPLVPRLLQALSVATPGQVIRVR